MNADLLCSTKTEIYGEWFVAKPERKPLLMRIIDAYYVLTGKGVCVTFTETLNVMDVVNKRVKELIKRHNQLQDIIKKQPTNIVKVVETKLTRELQKMSVSFVGNEVKLKKYDVLHNNQNKLIISDGVKNLNCDEISDMSLFYEEVQLRFVYSKIMDIFSDVEKTIKYMKESE